MNSPTASTSGTSPGNRSQAGSGGGGARAKTSSNAKPDGTAQLADKMDRLRVGSARYPRGARPGSARVASTSSSGASSSAKGRRGLCPGRANGAAGATGASPKPLRRKSSARRSSKAGQ